MKYITIIFSTLSLTSAMLEALSPLEKAADAPEGWLQVCCQDNDKNDDGAISFREFTPFVLNLMDVDRKTLGQIFLAGDLDRNSDLDGNECPIIRAQLRDRMRQKVNNALKFDSNGDGNLDREEVQKLAKRDFKLSNNEANDVFSSFHGPVSGSSLIDLLLELRARQVQKAGKHINIWDNDSNGKISYEELKRGTNGSIPQLTLKQAFKTVDYDKDVHLSKFEFLSLLNELERSHVNTDSLRTKRSDDFRSFAKEEDNLKDDSLLQRGFAKDDFPGDAVHHIVPRAETAPIQEDVSNIQISGEIDKQFVNMISLPSLETMSGGHPPTEMEVVTVKYDDPDFQRFVRLL